LSIGFDPNYGVDADRQVQVGLKSALAACQDLGAELRPLALPTPDEALAIHGVIFCAESAAYHGAEFPDKLDQYPPLVRQLFDMAGKSGAVDYVLAMRTRDAITRRMDALFEDVDFIVAPTVPVLPPPADAETVTLANKTYDFTFAMVRYTCLFDHTGHPVVAMPATIAACGLATSIQVIGRHRRDGDVLAFAARLEHALNLTIDYPMRA
jgi:Asp-tRNA(Asn)/Glu-tRNA(Gln) amidotransferase A subunit family amidase